MGSKLFFMLLPCCVPGISLICVNQYSVFEPSVMQPISQTTYDLNSKLLDDCFGPFEYQTSLLFRSPLYSDDTVYGGLSVFTCNIRMRRSWPPMMKYPPHSVSWKKSWQSLSGGGRELFFFISSGAIDERSKASGSRVRIPGKTWIKSVFWVGDGEGIIIYLILFSSWGWRTKCNPYLMVTSWQ